MEKLDRDFESSDYIEFDDVLDHSFFTDDDMVDLEEDESNYDVNTTDHRPISEL